MQLESRSSEEPESPGQLFDTMLPRYGLAGEPTCRCAVCESHRAAQLTQALGHFC